MARRVPPNGYVHDGAVFDVYMNTKRRAAKTGMEFTLSVEEFRGLMATASGRCTISGVRFRRVPSARAFMRQPFYPSIDRIDNTLGYTLNNCRIVCLAVNVAMNGWGPSVLSEIVKGFAGLERGKKKQMETAEIGQPIVF